LDTPSYNLLPIAHRLQMVKVTDFDPQEGLV